VDHAVNGGRNGAPACQIVSVGASHDGVTDEQLSMHYFDSRGVWDRRTVRESSEVGLTS
jgi:hypothetical protein